MISNDFQKPMTVLDLLYNQFSSDNCFDVWDGKVENWGSNDCHVALAQKEEELKHMYLCLWQVPPVAPEVIELGMMFMWSCDVKGSKSRSFFPLVVIGYIYSIPEKVDDDPFDLVCLVLSAKG